MEQNKGEIKVEDLGTLTSIMLFNPKISKTLKDYIKANFFGSENDLEIITKNLTWHYNLNVCETLIRKSNLDPAEIVSFIQFRERCRVLNIDYIEF